MHGEVLTASQGSNFNHLASTGVKQECRHEGSFPQDLLIDSTTHKQPTFHQQIQWKPAATANSDPQHMLQHATQADPCSIQQQKPLQTCFLHGDGKLTKPLQASTGLNSKSSKDTPASQKQQQAGLDEALAAFALASQNCSLATDVEVMDRVFDELVLLDPIISKALLHTPPIHFTTVTPAQHDSSKAAECQPQDIDNCRTFITACQVPEIQNTQHNPKLNMTYAAQTVDAGKADYRLSGFVAQPELAASTDLFSWKNISQSGSCDGARARLHSLSFDPTLQQKSSASTLGVRWADGGYVSTSGAAEHTPRTHRLLSGQPSLSGAAPKLSLSLASLSKPQENHLTAALVSSIQYQQNIPSMDDLKYQMDDIRKLHLAGVAANAAVIQQQQQFLQQQMATHARPITADVRARSPAKAAAAADQLASFRSSPSTPKFPQQSARQQPPAWQRLLTAQSDKQLSKEAAVRKSFVGMRADAPSWKRTQAKRS